MLSSVPFSWAMSLVAWKYSVSCIPIMPHPLSTVVRVAVLTLPPTLLFNMIHFYDRQRGCSTEFKRLGTYHLKFDMIDRLLGTILSLFFAFAFPIWYAALFTIVKTNPVVHINIDSWDLIRGWFANIGHHLTLSIWLLSLTCFTLTCICFTHKCHLLTVKIQTLVKEAKRTIEFDGRIIEKNLNEINRRYNLIASQLRHHNQVWSSYLMLNTIAMSIFLADTFLYLQDFGSASLPLKIMFYAVFCSSLITLIFTDWLSGLIKEESVFMSRQLYSLSMINFSSISNQRRKVRIMTSLSNLAFSLHKHPLCFKCGALGRADYKLTNRILSWIVPIFTIIAAAV